MVLCVDIGNSNINICVFNPDSDAIVHSFAITSDIYKTSDEYCVVLNALLKNEFHIAGAIIGSVVPQLTPIISNTVKSIYGIDALVVGPGVKTSLNIKTDNPAEVGADIVANAVYAIDGDMVPAVIIDFGTATTIVSIDESKKLTNVFILPGLYSSYKALTKEAAAIPSVPLYTPNSFLGKNTANSVNSGVVYSNAFAIDGFVDKLTENSKGCSLLATGAAAPIVLPLCKNNISFNENLTCRGLYRIYLKNVHNR